MQTYETYLNEARVQYTQQYNDWMERAADASKRRDEAVHILSRCAADYAVTGVGVVQDGLPYIHVAGTQRTRFTWHKFYRGLAKEFKRPYVMMNITENDHWKCGFLEIVNQRRTEPLLAGLLLVANPTTHSYPRPWYIASQPHKVMKHTTKSLHRFTFKDAEALELLRNHVASWATDPAARKALGL